MINQSLYAPTLAVTFKPELADEEFKSILQVSEGNTLVSPDRMYVLYSLLKQMVRVPGELWECGVYKGGTAMMMAEYLRTKTNQSKKMVLFDTFEGMPETRADMDLHHKGDFADTSVEAVRSRLDFPFVEIVKGRVPETFVGRESAEIAMAHVDVDIYDSVMDCCEFIYPRLVVGGVMVFDDYGFPTCPGALKAVNQFFADKPSVPLILPTGQALIFKS